jgi:hypothetical protein
MVLSLLELAKTVDDPIRDALQHRADHFLTLVMWSTRLVLIGVVVEGTEFAVEFGAWIVRQVRRKRERANLKEVNNIFPAYENSSKDEREFHLPKRVKFVAFTGLVLVVVGVAGELDFEYKLEIANGDIQSLDNDQTSKAKQEADEVGTQTDSLEKRLVVASAQLEDIEQAVRVQGPRWKLLEDGKHEFIESLKPFSGQRFTVEKCGLTSPVEQERLEQDLLNFLGKQGAGWAMESPGYAQWTECANGATSFGGNLVTFSSNADKAVRHSAQALVDALNSKDISTVTAPTRPEWMPQLAAALGQDSPQALAVKDPSAVIILVGPNPMFDLAGWKKRKK